MAEDPTGCRGGEYCIRCSAGSAYSPLRKNVMEAPTSRARARNRGNRPVDRLAAPSQEKTTNCGGAMPGVSRSGTGWWGCGPVLAVDPSPMRTTGGTGGADGGGAADTWVTGAGVGESVEVGEGATEEGRRTTLQPAAASAAAAAEVSSARRVSR